jgi:plastocyanin
MLNNATKLFLALIAAALVAAVGYAVVVGDRAGADLFVALAGGFAVLTAIAALVVGDDAPPAVAPDAPGPEARTAYTEADVPTGAPWPFVGAVALAALALAAANGSRWLAGALAFSLIPALGWLGHVWREHPSFSARVRQRVVERLLAPLAMPVLGTLGALFIAVMVSRVLLAISDTASWVTALVLAAVLLVVLWMISSRPRLQPSALVGVAVVAVLGMTAAGALGASAGEREFHPHHPDHPVASLVAHNVQFSASKLEFPADTDVEIKFDNLDEGTFHNVAFYTSAEPGARPLWAGKPLPGGKADYKVRTPDAGTYAFVCDFHPTMKGELIITPSTGEGHDHARSGH